MYNIVEGGALQNHLAAEIGLGLGAGIEGHTDLKRLAASRSRAWGGRLGGRVGVVGGGLGLAGRGFGARCRFSRE